MTPLPLAPTAASPRSMLFCPARSPVRTSTLKARRASAAPRASSLKAYVMCSSSGAPLGDSAVSREDWFRMRRCLQLDSMESSAESEAIVTTADDAPGPVPATLQALTKACLAAAAFAFAAFLFPSAAHAARSGGRMGGSSFGRSSATASTFSAPSRGASVGGGGHASTSVVHHHHAPIISPLPLFFSPFHLAPPVHVVGDSAMNPELHAGARVTPAVNPFPILNIVASLAMTVFMIGMIKNIFGGDEPEDDYSGQDGITVIRIQVGMLGLARDLQLDLEEIADKADTDTEDGLHFILTETVLSILRSPEYWAYGSAASASFREPEAAEERFGSLSLEERGKFKEETFGNVDGRKRRSEMKSEATGVTNEFIVVTLIAAVDGGMKIPKVEDTSNLRSGLTRLGGVRVDQVAAVEVLWTPQDINDSLTAEELLRDYPNMIPL